MLIIYVVILCPMILINGNMKYITITILQFRKKSFPRSGQNWRRHHLNWTSSSSSSKTSPNQPSLNSHSQTHSQFFYSSSGLDPVSVPRRTVVSLGRIMVTIRSSRLHSLETSPIGKLSIRAQDSTLENMCRQNRSHLTCCVSDRVNSVDNFS